MALGSKLPRDRPGHTLGHDSLVCVTAVAITAEVVLY